MISKFLNLKRLSLYFDYLKRFEVTQLIHLIKSRLIINLFPKKIRCNIKTSDRIDETSFEEFIVRFKLLFTSIDGYSVTIDEIVEGSLLKGYYFVNLQDRFIKSMEKNFFYINSFKKIKFLTAAFIIISILLNPQKWIWFLAFFYFA